MEVNVFLICPGGCYNGLLTINSKEIYFISTFSDINENDSTSTHNSSSISPIITTTTTTTSTTSTTPLSTVSSVDNIGNFTSNIRKIKRRKWNLSSIFAVYLRRYRLRDTAIEVFFTKGKHRSFFIDFGSKIDDSKRRNQFIKEFIKYTPKSSFKQLPELSIHK